MSQQDMVGRRNIGFFTRVQRSFAGVESHTDISAAGIRWMAAILTPFLRGIW
jgi:hypothetical protein